MHLEIRLLGTPTVLRDGVPIPPPRGAKPWGLMAYLLLTPTAAGRARLASILFAEAEDPLAALRWNLNALRRLLGESESLRGDPIQARLPGGSWIDVLILRSGSWPEIVELAGLGSELLEGLSFGGSPGFEAWLTAQRRRVAADSEAALREASLVRIATRDFAGAAMAAGQLVAMNPLDEGAHELLVRALATGGRENEARSHLEHAARLIRTELGVEPGPQLLSAADPVPPPSRPVQTISVKAAMDAGLASLMAGQSAGVLTLRKAVDDARAVGEPQLLLRALLNYGTALSFTDSLQGERDAAGLHEAIALAERLPSARLAAHAHWELAFAEYWRAHYDRATSWIRSATSLAQDDPAVMARISYLNGCILTETARYREAMRALDQALEGLDQDINAYDISFATTMLGRAQLLQGSLDAAERTLDRALALTRARWSAFVPWVESFRADVALRRRNLAEASELFEHAYALACHHYRSNRCQCLSARGLGLVSAARGDIDAAVRWLDVARTRFPQSSGRYAWFRAYALEGLCDLAVAHHLPGAQTWIASLEEISGRHGMSELLACALLHRGRLGDKGAIAAAQAVAVDIDNPALQAVLAA